MVTVRVTPPLGVGRSEGSAEGLGAAGAVVLAEVAAVDAGDSDGRPNLIGKGLSSVARRGKETNHATR